MNSPASPRYFTVGRLVSEAAKLTGYTREEILSHTREQGLCRVRFAIMQIGRQRYSFPQIGRVLRRDHSTVQHGVQRARELLADDEDFRSLVFNLRASV